MASGSGEACLSMRILQSGEEIYSRPAPLAGVLRILRARPSAAGPFLLMAFAQSCIWGGSVPPFGTPEHHFGTLGAPQGITGAAGWTRPGAESDFY